MARDLFLTVRDVVFNAADIVFLFFCRKKTAGTYRICSGHPTP
jgi:hypothetical protein